MDSRERGARPRRAEKSDGSVKYVRGAHVNVQSQESSSDRCSEKVRPRVNRRFHQRIYCPDLPALLTLQGPSWPAKLNPKDSELRELQLDLAPDRAIIIHDPNRTGTLAQSASLQTSRHRFPGGLLPSEPFGWARELKAKSSVREAS